MHGDPNGGRCGPSLLTEIGVRGIPHSHSCSQLVLKAGSATPVLLKHSFFTPKLHFYALKHTIGPTTPTVAAYRPRAPSGDLCAYL